MSKKCKCILCGKEYETCNCSSDLTNRAWKIICDTSEHYQIYLILNDYKYKNIDKQTAKNLLNNFDLSNYKEFNKSAVKLITSILTESNSKRRNTKSKIIEE